MAEYSLVPARPQYEHDCPDCKFLGSEARVDFWVCPADVGGMTYIARYGNRPSDNASTPLFIIEQVGDKVSPDIWAAYQQHQRLRKLGGDKW